MCKSLLVFHWNYVCISYRFWDIQRQIMVWPWNRGKGRWRSLNMAPFDWSYMTYYWSAVVSIARSCTILKLFDVKWYRDLQIWVKGHWKSLKNCTIREPGYSFLFVFYSNYGRRAVCEVFSVKEWRDLENWVRGCPMSLKMVPFDRPFTTFYWSAVVSIGLSCTIFELFNVE